MKWRIKNNMARYIRTHTHTCTHTCNDKKQKTRSVRKGLRKDILPPGGEQIKDPKKKKMLPKNTEYYPCPLKMPKVKWMPLVVY